MENEKTLITQDYRQFLVDTLEKRLKTFFRQYHSVLKKPEQEPVHDLRVSIRRLTAIISLLEKIGRADFGHIRADLKNLMKPLGDLRDVQVRIGWIEHYLPLLDGAPSKTLDALRLIEKTLMSGIADALKSIRLDRTHGLDIQECIAPLDQRLEKSGVKLSKLCYNEIAALLNGFDGRVARFNKTGKVTDFHRARIAFKKFRYTLEIFLPYYTDFDLGNLHAFQTTLGDIRDLDVMIEWLRAGAGQQEGPWRDELLRLIENIQPDRDRRFHMVEKALRGNDKIVRKWRSSMKKAKKGSTKKSALKEARPEVLSLCERFDPDPPHAVHVTNLALQLFDGLTKIELLDLPEHYRTLLEYGCLLHDIGWVEGQQGHHKTAFRMIVESDLPLERQNKLIVAYIARFHRKADPEVPKMHPRLTRRDCVAITRLSAIIRVSDVLDRMHNQTVNIKELVLKEDLVQVSVTAGALGGIPEAALEKKTDYFPRAFGLPIRIVEETQPA